MSSLKEISAVPEEILGYADRLVKDGSGASLRIAFLLIDNAIEIMTRTYLQLVMEPDRRPSQSTSGSENFGDLLFRALEHAGAGDRDFQAINSHFHRIRSRLYHEGSRVIPNPRAVTSYLEVARDCLDLFFGFDDAKGPKEIDTLPYDLSLVLAPAGSKQTAIERDVIYIAEHELEYGKIGFEDGLSALVQLGRIDEEEGEVLRLGLRLNREDVSWYRKNRELAEWFVRVSFRVNETMQEIFFRPDDESG